jgi:hypothetical protein
MPSRALEQRIAEIDWEQIRAALDERGYAIAGPLLTSEECAALIELYDDRQKFRSRIDMARHRFGVGEYKYFAYPLPAIVATLREALYGRVAPLANGWHDALKLHQRFPARLEKFLDECHRAGQVRPTPLMLRYEANGYNCLHQDLYGEIAFPLQFTLMLSRPATDFEGGEFLLIENRPRAQSRGEAIKLEQGCAILFPTRYRPVRSTRGWSRVAVRHGVSRIEQGHRVTLGIIFHDAK